MDAAVHPPEDLCLGKAQAGSDDWASTNGNERDRSAFGTSLSGNEQTGLRRHHAVARESGWKISNQSRIASRGSGYGITDCLREPGKLICRARRCAFER